jgi:hypothetical protein
MNHQDLLYDAEASEGASALGTGSAEPDSSSAETINTDTPEGGPPDTIPYSRFKEVNDQLVELRPYRDLAQLGYDADSLRQLAEFEAGFQADPAKTWLTIASNIEQLPPEVRETVQRHLDSSPQGGAQSGSEKQPSGQDGEMPDWARGLTQKVDALSESETQRQQRESSEANNRLLDGVMAGWRKLDEDAGLSSIDERKMLTFIVGHARSSDSPEDLLRNARNEWLELREESLGSALKPGGNASAPRPVPGGGAPVNAQEPPKTLAEASLRAKARLEAGG